MKTQSIFIYLFPFFICLLIIGCNNDDDEIIPEPIPELTNIGTGVRLSIDSIVCLRSKDEVGGGHSDNETLEVYGYIRAWTSFDYTVSNEKENYEKLDTSMLWFRNNDDLVYLTKDEVLSVRTFTDLFFDNNQAHLAKINLDFLFIEYDPDEATWGNSAVSNLIMYTEEIDGDNDRISPPIKISMEDIEYYDRVFKKTYTQYIRNNWHGDDANMQLEIHYSFHPVPIKSAAPLPEGYAIGDEVIEPDLYPDIPTISAYAAAPPEKSSELVVGQKVLGNFSPEPLMVRTDSVKYHVYGLNPKYVSGSLLQNPVFNSIERPDNSGEDPWNGLIFFGHKPLKAPDGIIGPKLESKPIIQMVRYWVPINVERIAAGVTLTTSEEITHGVGAEFSYEYSITTGIGASAGVLSFSQEISQTFGFSVSYNYSVTYTTTKEIAAPDDKNVSFITWQLVEEIRVVNEQGELYTDPSYDFKSMLIATIPTNHIVQEAHQFSAD